ncbi:hypothetical protein BD414DRAFT_578504 [Trametes punicea]|nr:hypothetical protein BD414DRAFT_578504 [Trametes punicea]
MMGSAQSLISVGAVLAIVGAITYGFTRPGDPMASSSTQAASSKKKQKKKLGAATDAKESPPAEPNVASFPPVIPGDFDSPSETAEQPSGGGGGASKASKRKKKAKKGSSSVPQDAQSESSATAPESSTAAAHKPRKSATPKPAASTAAADEEGWTKVETKKKSTASQQAPPPLQGAGASLSAPERPLEISTSDAGITTSVTTNSSPVTERTEDESYSQLADSAVSKNRRTLAEKLFPKPRKTGVEDLLEKPDYPQLARVMRIQPRPDERPAAGFSWGDYEDVDDSRVTADDADGEDDGGWGVVRSRRSRPKQPASGPVSTPQKAPETMTKKQRQHAARREAEKAAKAQAEAERLAVLAQHKREVEKARIAEQNKSSKKQVSGGMSAYVDENGKLVWQ